MIEGPRGVIAIENGYECAGPGHAGGLAEHGQRIGHVADCRVGDHGVKGCIGQVESLDVADLELGSLRDVIAGSETHGGLQQRRALVHADHSAVEISASGQRSRRDAGAAPEIQDGRRRPQAKPGQVIVTPLREGGILAPKFQAVDKALNCRLI